MSRKSGPFLSNLAQVDPGLGVLRLAALLADGSEAPDDETLDEMFELVEAGALADTKPTDIWLELVRGLMARHPSKMIIALHECGALKKVLPEVADLFGVPQITDDPTPVDLGEHLLKSLDEAAWRDAPLAVRFALLVMNVGKADSPPEHLPVHYRHVERGGPRIKAIAGRFAVSGECADLALLALSECERVHRASEIRAGPVTAMLERLGAFDAPERFSLMMTVCACDYCAYGERSGEPYPKRALLERALAACATVDKTAYDGEDVQDARATAIARAFRSQRWAGGAEE